MKRLAIVLALLAAALSGGAGRSQAVFTATSSNTNQSFAAAAVFNEVTVAMTNPGTPLRATASLSATASSDRPIVSVRFQYAPAGTSTWTDACTASSSPYGCGWDTTAVTDGSYDLRAIATDSSNYSRTSATITGRQVDNTGPAVTLTNPGSPLTGSRTIAATATPTGSAVSAVAIDYRTSPSGTWTQICSDGSAPYQCAWNTGSLDDGLYDLRARATDAVGNASTSAVVEDRRLDNDAPAVSIPDDGPRRGMATIRATLDDGAGSGIASVRYEVLYDGTWLEACESASAPFSCSVDSTQVPDGSYNVRAVATDNAGLSTTSATRPVLVDNTAPATATLSNVTGPLSGTVTLGGTATDTGSGIATLRLQFAPAGTTTWADACADTGAPYSCAWNTTAVADGVYDLRAVAVDGAGNTLASSTLANRRVDNLAPTVALGDPGTPLTGSETLTATASDGGGIGSVLIERKPSSGSTWTAVCTDYTAPYSCTWDTTAIADGTTYDLRATATDNAGRTATSLLTGRVVGNGPRASAVTSTGTNSRPSNGDTLRLTYNEAPLASSLVAGWTGAAGRPVSILFTRSGTNTTVAVTDSTSGASVPLGSLTLTGNFTSVAAATATGNMTLTGSELRLTLTSSPSGMQNASTPFTLTWTSSAAVTDAAGYPGAAANVTGSGQL